MKWVTGFAALGSLTPTMLSLDGRQDFHISICRGLFAEKSMTSVDAGTWIRDFRIHYFGERKRLTKERRKEFFSNERNFIDI